MEIREFQCTGADEVESFLTANNIAYANLRIDQWKELFKLINFNFVVTGLTRVQSTELCNLRDSYVQQSQRYVLMDDTAYVHPFESGVIAIPGTRGTEDNPSVTHPELYDKITEVIKECFDLYAAMTPLSDPDHKGRTTAKDYLYGIPIEDGRYILPLATTTAVSFAMSGDKFIDFIQMIMPETGIAYSAWNVIGCHELYYKIMDEIPVEIENVINNIIVDKFPLNDQNSVVDKMYRPIFNELTWDKNIKMIGCFEDPIKTVAIGALTSTKQDAFITLNKSYTSDEDRSTLISNVMGYNHMSIIEQQRTTFAVMLSLTAYHQMIRHRLPAMHTESLEDVVYHGMRDGRSIYIPETIKNSKFLEDYIRVANKVRDLRNTVANECGVSVAKHMLLNCDGIKFIQSTNARIDLEMLTERTCNNAAPEIRNLAQQKVRILNKISPLIYGKALPKCLKGGCTEGKLSCGNPPKF